MHICKTSICVRSICMDKGHTTLTSHSSERCFFKEVVAPLYGTFKCLSNACYLSAAPLISATAYWGMPAIAAPLVPCEPPPPPVPALPPQPPLPPSQPPYEPPAAKALPVDKTKKGKKDKVRI